MTNDPNELRDIKDFDGQPGTFIVQPDPFGTEGAVAFSWKQNVPTEKIQAGLVEFARDSSRMIKNHNQHVRQGRRDGKEWTTEIPVTAPDAIRAQQRGKLRRVMLPDVPGWVCHLP